MKDYVFVVKLDHSTDKSTYADGPSSSRDLSSRDITSREMVTRNVVSNSRADHYLEDGTHQNQEERESRHEILFVNDLTSKSMGIRASSELQEDSEKIQRQIINSQIFIKDDQYEYVSPTQLLADSQPHNFSSSGHTSGPSKVQQGRHVSE